MTTADFATNESECAPDYHECMVAYCGECAEVMVWNWDLDPPKWVHVDPPDDHDFQWGPPEHWDWIQAKRARLDGQEDGK